MDTGQGQGQFPIFAGAADDGARRHNYCNGSGLHVSRVPMCLSLHILARPFNHRCFGLAEGLSKHCILQLTTLMGVMWLAGPTAWGVGLSPDGAGGRAAAMGGVGTAVADDPLSALFNNPAALADLGSRPQAQLGGDVGFLGGSFHNRANADASLDAAAGIGQFAASVPVGPLSFGLGVNPDLAARVSGRYVDAPGGADGATSYGDTRNTSELLLLRSAVGAGYRLAPNCFLGLSVGLLYNVNELHTNYVFQSQPVLRTVKTGLDLDTTGLGYNFQAGFRWRPVPRVSLNVAYTSRSQVQSHGLASGNAGVQLTHLGLGAARQDFTYDAQVTNHFPQMVNAGVAWEPPWVKGLTVGAQFDWINWSEAFHDLPIHLTNGNNANLNALVGSHTLNDDVPLRWRDSDVGRFGCGRGFLRALGRAAGLRLRQPSHPRRHAHAAGRRPARAPADGGRRLPRGPLAGGRRLPVAAPGDGARGPQRPGDG